MVYGDVVVSRHTVRGTAISSIFVKKDGHWQLLQAETEMTFVKNENGQVTGVVLRLGSCQDSKAKKIE